MSEGDQGIVRTTSIGVREKIIGISMLVILFLALVVPVSQAARNRELQIRERRIVTRSALVDEDIRLAQARLAEAGLPEVTLRQAVLQGLGLEKIVFEEAKIVVVEE